MSLLLSSIIFSSLFFSSLALDSREKNESGTLAQKVIQDTDNLEFSREDGQNQNIDTAVANRFSSHYHKEALKLELGNLTGKFQIKYRPESFYGKNINLLNSNNISDRLIFNRSTIDFNIGLDYGKQCFGSNVMNFFGTVRNKSTWGVPESVARTTETRLKIIDVVDKGHKHFITKQIMWIRELWLKFNVNEVVGLSFHGDHWFTIGAFPFELGRGIALGTAFAVNPGPLGFYSDNSIDQYAFGAKLNGDISKDKATYDLYCAVLQNKSSSISETAEIIYQQRCLDNFRPERGSGHINYIAAGRMKLFPVQDDKSSLIFEPYALVNSIPESRVEFTADARAVLGTFGCAGEFVAGNFEFGFDTARNVGKQTVFAWDRNIIEAQNYQSLFSEVNSMVNIVDVNDPTMIIGKVPFVSGSEAQNLIDQSTCDPSQDGVVLNPGIANQVPNPRDPNEMITIANAANRFRGSYSNTVQGWMLVADGAWWFHDRQMRLAVAGGVASGDEDPNLDLDNPNSSRVDGDFKGFIGLQEIYTGNRVQSAFVLGGAGRVPRPLTKPRGRNVINKFPTQISGFTNLIFTGCSYYWSPTIFQRWMELRTNLLSYWQYFPTKAFDLVTKQSSTENARNHLGVEWNVFMSVDLIKDFKFFAVGSVFVPGDHYADIKGTPLNKAQQAFLDRVDKSGNNVDNFPLLGDDPAWTVNVGLEYRF